MMKVDLVEEVEDELNVLVEQVEGLMAGENGGQRRKVGLLS